MAYTTKKFLDQTGTGYLWGKIKQALDLKADASDLTTLEGRVDDNEDAIEALQGLHAANKTVAQEVSDGITALNLANTYAGKSYETKVDTLIDDDTGKSVREIANEELAAQLIPENADASLDTLQEIAQWIQDHPDDAAAMNSDISDLQDKLELGTHTVNNEQVEYETVKDYVEAEVAGLQASSHTHSNKSVLDGITSTQVTNWDQAATDDHTHTNKSVLDGITAADVAAWDAAEQNAKDYADGLAGDYATAAQGALADTALQPADITTGSTNGTISVDGSDVGVYGLGTAAYENVNAFDAAGDAAAVYAAIQALTSAEIDAAIASASSGS